MVRQTAKLNYLKIAPRKVRLAADLLRGLSVNEAEAQLLLLKKRVAPVLLKLLRSAVANAKNNQKLEEDKLFIESIRVDGGPMLKRYLPRARGRATPIQKKMSHVTIVLAPYKPLRGSMGLAEKAELRPPRFRIVRPKKAKLPPGASRPKKGKKPEEVKEVLKPKKPGFFQRLFRRKAV